MAKETLVNKIANSSLITLDMEKLLHETDWCYLDIKPFLFKEMVLMEKSFRESLKDFDWSPFQNKWVGLHCSTDALIPHWAFMLLCSYLKEAGAHAFFASGDKSKDERKLIQELIQNIDAKTYTDQRVIVKGCGNLELDASYYLQITQKLLPTVKSLMYGEPCSTVPIYKSRK